MTQINNLKDDLLTAGNGLESSGETQSIEEPEQNEREYYKDLANRLGLKYANNITLPKLKEMVQAHMREQDEKQKAGELGVEVSAGSTLTAGGKANKIRDEALRLVRFRLQVLNPTKQQWTGEYFTAGNDLIGHITRFIPFQMGEDGWHAEKILIDMLKERKYQRMHVKGGNGRDADVVDPTKNKLLPEFAIEILPNLTEQELADLAARQDAQGSLRED